MSLRLIELWTVLRPCGGIVELFEVPEDTALPYRVRITLPQDKQYAAVFRDEKVARAVAKNWVAGEAMPPWVHLLDGAPWA